MADNALREVLVPPQHFYETNLPQPVHPLDAVDA